MLQIEADAICVPIKFGDARKLKKGQIVIALGNPYAIARDGQASASWGIVSNLARKDGPCPSDERPAPTKPTLHQYGTLIQTDAKLNLGTSGGALLNLKGEMIGLTMSLAAASGYEQAAGFAIPVDETFSPRAEHAQARQRSRIRLPGRIAAAVMRRARPQRHARRHGDRRRWQARPPSAVAAERDDVITHVNDRAIHDPDELLLHVGKLPPDASVRLTVERDGRSQSRD